MGKANGTIRCRIAAKNGQPRVKRVIFTPEKPIKFGKREFVAFVREKGDSGFVVKLRNGSIKLRPDAGLGCPHLLSQAALGNTKVTVIASRDLVLKALIVPADE